jgi:hypothetical protein
MTRQHTQRNLFEGELIMKTTRKHIFTVLLYAILAQTAVAGEVQSEENTTQQQEMVVAGSEREVIDCFYEDNHHRDECGK